MDSRIILYLLIVVAGLTGGLLVAERKQGIFECAAGEYAASRYLAYCGGYHYGDYDHGAFWLDLEPRTLQHAAAADVLFLGNSRLLLAFSSHATAEWFASRSRSYYLLGFMYDESMSFARELLDRVKPKARLYVINLDSYFRRERSGPAQSVVTDPLAPSSYRAKRRWQAVHRFVCGRVPRACGHSEAWFRSVDTGAFVVRDGGKLSESPREVGEVDRSAVDRQIALAEPFLATLGVPRECVVFTIVPYRNTPTATARALASALGVTFLAPSVEGLETFDGSHLTADSAERWSAEFLREAGPSIDACIAQTGPVPGGSG